MLIIIHLCRTDTHWMENINLSYGLEGFMKSLQEKYVVYPSQKKCGPFMIYPDLENLLRNAVKNTEKCIL